MLPPGITKIIRAKDLGKTPAKCYRDTGVIVTNDKIFPKLPKDTQKFIIAHEAGHIVFDTTDEYMADEFGGRWCLAEGVAPTKISNALTDVLSLPADNPILRAEQIARMNHMLDFLLKYDYEVNKNPKANPMKPCYTCMHNESEFLGKIFPGLAKKQAAKTEKKLAKADSIRDEAQAKLLEAQAKLEMAKSGVSPDAGGEEPKDNTTLIVVIAVVVIIGLVVAWMYFKKRNKKA